MRSAAVGIHQVGARNLPVTTGEEVAHFWMDRQTFTKKQEEVVVLRYVVTYANCDKNGTEAPIRR